MKVKEVRDLLNKYVEHQPNLDEYDLSIVLSEPSIGGRASASASVTSISAGFDWDSGKMFLHTKERLVNKK